MFSEKNPRAGRTYIVEFVQDQESEETEKVISNRFSGQGIERHGEGESG